MISSLVLGIGACGGCDDGAAPEDRGLGDTSVSWARDAGSTAPEMGVQAQDAGGQAQADADGTQDAGVPDSGDAGDEAYSSVCGDGVAAPDEACDDGNSNEGDYCSADCRTVTGSCGDGTRQSNEACDDGGTDDGDYCSADCQTANGSCGDGVRQGHESCDDGRTSDCVGTHDGGDGACVPTGSCSAGFTLSGSTCVPTNTTGLTEPCQNGAGYAMFRFHYSNNSTSAQLDVWDATCAYSFAPNSACNVYEICPGFCDPPVTSEGYPIFNTSNYLRVRFSANGLNFSQATLYVQARSYATSSSTSFRAWSPLYGDALGGPVDNDFVYDWYAVDWSNYLSPFDDPAYTAIQIYGANGSLAVKAVELCVE